MDIHAPNKTEAKKLLIAALTEHLDALPDGSDVMLKVTIPSVDGRYGELIRHTKMTLYRVFRYPNGDSKDMAKPMQ